jgi:hypothetical protein
MDAILASNLLKWVHLSSMVFAIGAAASCSLLAARAARESGQSSALWKFYDFLSPIALIAFVALLVSGPLLFWVKYQFGFFTTAFWIKMVLIVALIVVVVIEERATRRVRGGDMGALRALDLSFYGLRILELGIILAAVFAFN